MEAVTIYITFWTAFQYEYSSCQINDYYQVSPPTSEMIVSSPLPSVLISMPRSKKKPCGVGLRVCRCHLVVVGGVMMAAAVAYSGIAAQRPIVPIAGIRCYLIPSRDLVAFSHCLVLRVTVSPFPPSSESQH